MVIAGLNFEQLVKDLFDHLSINEEFTSVEGPRVFLDGKDGKREFDVILRSQVAGIEMLTVVECRDYSKKLDVTHIDGFLSKIEDVNANKGVMVSRKGFSKKAIRKAKRVGISLYIAQSQTTDEIASNIKQLGFSIPVVVSVIDDWDVSTNAIFFANKGTTIHKDALLNINDRHINDVVRDCVFNKKITIEQSDEPQTIRPFDDEPRTWIKDSHGLEIEVKEVTLSVQITRAVHYFGYVSQLPNSAVLIDQIKEQKTIFFKSDDLFDGEYRECFAEYSNLSSLPEVGAISLRALSIPNFDEANSQFSISQITDPFE